MSLMLLYIRSTYLRLRLLWYAFYYSTHRLPEFQAEYILQSNDCSVKDFGVVIIINDLKFSI